MKVCEVCGKGQEVCRIIKSKKFGKSLCNRHYLQLDQYGKIFSKTIFEKNRITINADICEMEIYNNKHEVIAVTKFNKKHLERVSAVKWHLNNNGYARAAATDVLLHKFIFPEKKGFFTDHIDRDRLNNLDSNLRYASRSQNRANSQCKGFYWEKQRNKWFSQINVNHKKYHLGFFETKEEALKARIIAEKRYLKEFAPQR